VVVEASITGLFRTVLIIIGVFVLLRFLGQLLIAKRNMEEERRINEQRRKTEKEKSDKLKEMGKIKILSDQKTKTRTGDTEDVDYEELK
jgi:hypothetical protein